MSQARSTERLQFKFSSDGDEADDAHGSDCEFSSSECEDCGVEDDGSERYDRESAIKLLTEFVASDDASAHANTSKALYDMMPDSGALESWAEQNLCGLFIDMVEQIPHNHPAQNKLAALMAKLARLDRFNVLEQQRTNLDRTSEGYMRIEYSYYTSFILFRREFVEIWSRTSPECYDARFVNLYAFHARLATLGLGHSLHFMIPSMRTVLEHYTEGCSVASRSILVMLAAVWILYGGQLFFHHIVVHPPLMTEGNWRSYRPGGLYNGPIFGLERWDFWQARLAELSDNSDISEEARDLGTRAADLMAALARTVK